MSRHVSVVRDAAGLNQAIRQLEEMTGMPTVEDGRAGWVTANMTLAALAIATAALRREESRGAHYRSDFPARDPALDGVHFVFQSQSGERDTWTTGALSTVLPMVRG
jgi:L-aspartate oxidase